MNPEEEIKKIVHKVEETAEKAVDTTIKTVRKVESTFVKWLKRLGKVNATILFIILTILSLLQLSSVQTYLARHVTDYLTDLTGFESSVEKVSIRWLDEVVLKNVLIKDHKKNTMIAVDELVVNYNLIGFFQRKDIILDQVGVGRGKVNLINNAKDSTLNIQAWIDAFGSGAPDTVVTTTLSDTKFIIREAYLQNTLFSYHDIYEDSLPKDEFDYFHFQLDSINGEIEHFVVANDTIEVKINTLSAVNPVLDFPIKELRTFFRLCDKSMNFQKLYANIGNSLVRDSVVFRYNDIGDMSDFNNKVKIHAKLKDSKITYADLAFFAPTLRQWQETIKVSGNFNGKVTDLKAKKLDLRFGKNSRLQGDIAMDGLPNIEETFIDYNLDDSQILLSDIRQYLTADQYRRVEKFGLVKFNSEFQGFYYDFVAHGDFNTGLGYLTTDNIHLNLGEKTNTYEGNLATKNFDLGELLLIPKVLQKIDFKGFIKGKGFTPSTAEADIDAQIDRFGVYGYDYQHINIDAKLSKSLFEGKISVKDSNFIFGGEGNISLKDSTIAFTGKIEKSLLHKINLATKPTFLKANMLINLKGLDLDRLEGTANINHFDLMIEDRKLDMDYFILVDKVISKEKRRVALGSSLVNFTAEGDFSVGETVNHIIELVEEYVLHFDRDSTQTDKYYTKKQDGFDPKIVKNSKAKTKLTTAPATLKPANFSYEFWLKNINPLFDFFQIKAKINQNAKIKGEFTYGQRSGITLKTKIDSLSYDNLELYYSDVDFSTSKLQDSTGTKGSIKVTSKYQFILNEKNELISSTDDFKLDAQLTDFLLKYNVFIRQSETTNSVDTKGSLAFLPQNAFLFDIDTTKLHLAGELWQNPEDSEVRIQGKEINLQNITFSNGEDFLSIVGDVSEDENKKLTVTIKDLELDVFSGFLGFKLGGVLNGFATLQSLYQQDKLKIENELKIDSVSINGFLIGNILNTSIWDTPNKAMVINLDIERDNRKTLLCKGTFTPDNEQSPLNLKVQLDELEVNILEPFLADIASKFGGTAKGELKITGKLAAPIVEGSAFVRRGKFTINYLGANYTFSDRIYLEKNRVFFKRFRMRDDQRSLAFLDGSIFHQGFQNFALDLKGRFSKFKLLDTKASDDALYYGTAIGSGTLSLVTAGSNLNIDVDVKSEQGTKMYLAFDGYSTVEQKDFISYTEFSPKRYKDTVQLKIKPSHPKVDLSRLLMNMNVEITPDAFAEIILDRKTGDIIRGNARGKINMKVDTKADFEMFGSVEIVQGAYNFTFQNLFNKEFGVASGSTITWSGDPLKGIMNIKATYLQRASFAPMLSENADNDSPELKRRYPIQVDLLLKGEVFSPEIKFDINFFDYPNTIMAGGQSISLTNSVAAFKTRLANDEAELNRQVFSLILLRKLSPPNSFTGFGQSAAGSVSELLTNQLSYWMSQVDENLEVDIDLNGLDANALNTFQLRLSYSFLNGRVRVTRDGSFTNMQNQANASSVIGDWTAEYLITPDGKLRVKMYRRNFSNVFDASLGNTSATTGVSFMYIRSFNKLKHFFGISSKKKKKEKTEKKKKESKAENF